MLHVLSHVFSCVKHKNVIHLVHVCSSAFSQWHVVTSSEVGHIVGRARAAAAIPGFWLSISTSLIPAASRRSEEKVESKTTNQQKHDDKKQTKNGGTTLLGVRACNASNLAFRITSSSLFISTPLCDFVSFSAAWEHWSHKDVHKLRDGGKKVYKKKGGGENVTSKAIHNWRGSLFGESLW